jgi:hypothetical protein
MLRIKGKTENLKKESKGSLIKKEEEILLILKYIPFFGHNLT